ncbi:MAG: hypothetical protein JSU95_13440 [Betaproteobacteria bacterium]|nr:MAG: hypothetical protein JSU95_13440 [Betaproteobacteria bacterium]
MDNNELISAVLDGEVSPDELGSALAKLHNAREERDAVTVYQLIKDAVGGIRVLDDGYTVRILRRLAEHRAAGKSR